MKCIVDAKVDILTLGDFSFEHYEWEGQAMARFHFCLTEDAF